MGFWRESKKLWIGPEHAWERLGIGESNLAMPPGTVRYESARQWPIVFHDRESLQTFWTVMENYAGQRLLVDGVYSTEQPTITATVDGHEFTTVEGLLGHPSRAIKSLKIYCSGPQGRNATVELHIRKSRTELPFFAHKGGYAFAYGLDVFTQDQSAKKFQGIWDSLEYTTRPATLRERMISTSVITKFTEAEYYAESRAAKVRWQSLGLGTLGGILTSAVASWLPLG